VCIYRHVWNPICSHKDIHAGHNLENNHGNINALLKRSYGFYKKMSKRVFIDDYPENPKNLGEELRKKWYDLGLQIKEVAKAIGVSEDSVINWELRKVTPRPKYLTKLLQLYGIKINDIS
jgi:DNA-binding XRE family transcriptional regulator